MGYIYTIGALASEVITKLENRTTDLTRAYQWLADAVLELTSSGELRDEFDDLEQLGPPFSLAPRVREYAFSTILNPGDYNDGTLDIRLWNNPPQNTVFQRLRRTDYQFTDNYSNNPGRPSAWYRFADNYGFDMIPDLPYQIQARYLIQHPIAAPPQNTVVQMPRPWIDVLILSAVQKGFVELNEYEKANATSQILHGDPRDPTKPGLIYKRKKRYQIEAWREVQPLRPYVGRYSR